MAHGAPDDSNVVKSGAVTTLQDMGELAARLGSIDTFDRRGDVLLLDSFEAGISKAHFVKGHDSADYYLELTYPKSGGTNLRLVGGSTGSRLVAIRYTRAYPVLSNMGFEVSVAFPVAFTQLLMLLRLYDGTRRHEVQIQYTYATELWEYLNSGGTYTSFKTDWKLELAEPAYHTFKIVLDAVNDKYRRVVLDHAGYLGDGADAYSVGETTAPYLLADFTFWSRDGESDYCYLDDIIVTQNEP